MFIDNNLTYSLNMESFNFEGDSAQDQTPYLPMAAVSIGASNVTVFSQHTAHKTRHLYCGFTSGTLEVQDSAQVLYLLKSYLIAVTISVERACCASYLGSTLGVKLWCKGLLTTYAENPFADSQWTMRI